MKKILVILTVALLALFIAPVFANNIVIDPYNPTVVTSPFTFDVYMASSNKVSYDPHIFLAMTEACHTGLTGDVVVDGQTITTWNFEKNESVKLPPDTEEGSSYTVASLKDHLDVEGTDQGIWWVFVDWIGVDMLQNSPVAKLPVDIDSSATKLLVYVVGKADPDDDLFSDKVPPTNPGFVVPEVATVLIAAASFSALGLYAFKRKRQ